MSSRLSSGINHGKERFGGFVTEWEGLLGLWFVFLVVFSFFLVVFLILTLQENEQGVE